LLLTASRFRAGEAGQPPGNVIVTLAAPAAVEIVFERCRCAHRLGSGDDRLFGQGRTAQIRMQHCAGQIEDAAL
jgi:hypothetical protein